MPIPFPTHICSQHLFLGNENLGYELFIYPEDVIIYKYNDKWWMSVGEYRTPILCCPYCGTELINKNTAS